MNILFRSSPGTFPNISSLKWRVRHALPLRGTPLSFLSPYSQPPQPGSYLDPLPSLSWAPRGPCFVSVTYFLSPFLLQLTSYTCDFLHKLSLIVWVLTLYSFLARTQVLRLNQVLAGLHWFNICCYFTVYTPTSMSSYCICLYSSLSNETPTRQVTLSKSLNPEALGT